jgi:hypothetical protein
MRAFASPGVLATAAPPQKAPRCARPGNMGVNDGEHIHVSSFTRGRDLKDIGPEDTKEDLKDVGDIKDIGESPRMPRTPRTSGDQR